MKSRIPKWFLVLVFFAFIWAVQLSLDANTPQPARNNDVVRTNAREEYIANCSSSDFSESECACIYDFIKTVVGEYGVYEIGQAYNNGTVNNGQIELVYNATVSCTK